MYAIFGIGLGLILGLRWYNLFIYEYYRWKQLDLALVDGVESRLQPTSTWFRGISMHRQDPSMVGKSRCSMESMHGKKKKKVWVVGFWCGEWASCWSSGWGTVLDFFCGRVWHVSGGGGAGGGRCIVMSTILPFLCLWKSDWFIYLHTSQGGCRKATVLPVCSALNRIAWKEQPLESDSFHVVILSDGRVRAMDSFDS